MANLNSPDYLEKCRCVVLENLKSLTAAPSVQFQSVPPDWALREAEEEFKQQGLGGEGGSGSGSGGSEGGPAAAATGTGSFGPGAVDGRRAHESEFYDDNRGEETVGRRGGGSLGTNLGR
jgi:hypothetical protein